MTPKTTYETMGDGAPVLCGGGNVGVTAGRAGGGVGEATSALVTEGVTVAGIPVGESASVTATVAWATVGVAGCSVKVGAVVGTRVA